MPVPSAVELSQSAVAARVRRRREAAGWSQQELGDRAGLSEFQVNAIETDAKRLSAGEVTALAGVLGLPLVDLLSPYPE